MSGFRGCFVVLGFGGLELWGTRAFQPVSGDEDLSNLRIPTYTPLKGWVSFYMFMAIKPTKEKQFI